MVNRGSEWGRWDLHVHTKGTAKNDGYTNISFDEYCSHLFKRAIDYNIKVIGITDYFNIENYKLVKTYQDNIENNNDFSDDEKEIIKKIEQHPVIPVYYNDDIVLCKNILDGCYEGGIRVFEFVNRGAKALENFAALVEYKNQKYRLKT